MCHFDIRSEDMNRLIQGDCLSVMDDLIKDGVQVDLTVTSPPYDNLRTYEGSLDWGEHIWKPIIEKLFKITKQGGVVVWVVGDATVNGSETGTSFKQALYFKEVGFNLHDTMIYQKASFIPLTHKRYEQSFEYMFVFSKGKPNTFNPVMIPTETYGHKKNRSKSKGKEDTYSARARNEITEVNKEKQAPNIFKYNVGENEKTEHNAPFPEQLAKDHILSWSNEGDTVFDPFMGSGTTGAMAIINKRDFIGIEKVPEYFQICEKRIAEAEKSIQLSLF